MRVKNESESENVISSGDETKDEDEEEEVEGREKECERRRFVICAQLWCASRDLFVGLPPKLSRQLARCVRFRDSGGFDSSSSIFENTVASKFSCEALRHTAFSVLFSASS